MLGRIEARFLHARMLFMDDDAQTHGTEMDIVPIMAA